MLNFISILIGKITYKALKILGKNGGNLPGEIVLKIRKNIFKYFKIKCPVIAVTGTNGKTTTTNFINHIFTLDGKIVITNKAGNNIKSGILTTLIEASTLTGKIKADYIVLEVDEHYIPVIFKEIKLDSLVVLNFFRDQLDRSGEVESLILKISKFLETYQGNLILNSDDPNVARLGKVNEKNKNVYYYSVDKYEYATKILKDVGEGKFCPFCKERLEYEYYQYSHIGKFKCPKCHYGENKIYKKLTDINLNNKTFRVDGIRYRVRFNGIYYIYNAAAVVALTSLYNVDKKALIDGLETFALNNGRLEQLKINDELCIINLAKNPAGANVIIRMLNEDPEDKELLFVLNDNIPDGLDVSWIWDINFNILEKVKRVITSGTRTYDIAIRIKYSGYDETKIEVYENIDNAIESLFKTKTKKYVITNYTAVQDTRKKLIEFKRRG